MKGDYEFSFTGEPMTTAEFQKYLEAIGSFSPLVMSERQLTTLISVLIRNYADKAGIEEYDIIALDAATMAFETEMNIQLDLSVGPEDGIQ